MGTGAWAKGSTPQWRRVRLQVLKRDNYQCQVKTKHCSYVATLVHHTLGKEVTGDDPAFLVACCRSCNVSVGTPKGNPPPRTVTNWD